MSDDIREITTISFSGPRFEGSGLDLEALVELLAYRKLLIETAKELWRSEYPERRRLPQDFEDSIRLKFVSFERGSAVVKRLGPGPYRFDEIDEAAQLIDETIRAVSDDQPLPAKMPEKALPLLADLGGQLRDDEAIHTRSYGSDQPAAFTHEIRSRLAHLLEHRDASANGDYDDSAPPLWQSVIDLGASVPAEEWDKVPTDLAANLDEYLYGSAGEDK